MKSTKSKPNIFKRLLGLILDLGVACLVIVLFFPMKKLTQDYYHYIYRKYAKYEKQPARKPEGVRVYSINFDKDVYQLFK